MKNLIYLILLLSLVACEKVTVGYLDADRARYSPDSLVIKAVLDSVTDEYQITNQIPYQSDPIGSVQGTSVIHYAVKNVHADNGFINALFYFGIVQKGKIQIPYDHQLPVGRYVIDIEISNEGYSVQKDSIFTVIVQ